jgi:phosphoglycolate phosphatase-like HAD superfamily hydrolase
MATLLFDLDGTLLDVGRRHYAVYSHVLRELGQPPLPEAEYWRRRRDGEGTLAVVGDLPGDLVFRFQAAWLERIESRHYLALDRPYAEVRGVLTELRRDHRLVLVTLRRDAAALAWQLSEARLIPFFKEVVSPLYYIPSRKSELLPFWYPIGETWVIGDSEADIELASDLGARCVCLSDGVRSAKFLRERGATIIASSVRELPAMLTADARRDVPAERLYQPAANA